MTGTALCTAALELLNIVGQGQTPSAEDAADAFARLNRLIDRLGTQRLSMGTLLRTVKVLTANQASYTIGATGQIPIAVPLTIDPQLGARTILDNSIPLAQQLEVPVTVFTDQEWSGIGLRGTTGTGISGIYFDHAWVAGLATIQVYPVPTTSTTSLVLYTPFALAQWPTPATDLTFAPGWAEMLEYNLAKRLLVAFPGKVDPQVAALILDEARTSLADVKRVNLRPVELSTGLAGALFGRGYVYDILRGE